MIKISSFILIFYLGSLYSIKALVIPIINLKINNFIIKFLEYLMKLSSWFF